MKILKSLIIIINLLLLSKTYLMESDIESDYDKARKEQLLKYLLYIPDPYTIICINEQLLSYIEIQDKKTSGYAFVPKDIKKAWYYLSIINKVNEIFGYQNIITTDQRLQRLYSLSSPYSFEHIESSFAFDSKIINPLALLKQLIDNRDDNIKTLKEFNDDVNHRLHGLQDLLNIIKKDIFFNAIHKK